MDNNSKSPVAATYMLTNRIMSNPVTSTKTDSIGHSLAQSWRLENKIDNESKTIGRKK